MRLMIALLSTTMLFSAAIPDDAFAKRPRHGRNASQSTVERQSKSERAARAPIVIVLPREGATKALADGYLMDSTGSIKNSSNQVVAILNDSGVFTNGTGMQFSKAMQLRLLGLMGVGLDFGTTETAAAMPVSPNTGAVTSTGATPTASNGTSAASKGSVTTNTGSGTATASMPGALSPSVSSASIGGGASGSTASSPSYETASSGPTEYNAPVASTPAYTAPEKSSYVAPSSTVTAAATTKSSIATMGTNNKTSGEETVATITKATTSNKPTLEYHQTLFGDKQRGPIRLLTIGDSMTRGGDPNDPTENRSYRGRLEVLLKTAGYDVDFLGTDYQASAQGTDGDVSAWGGAYIGFSGLVGTYVNPDNNIMVRLPGIKAATDPNLIIAAMGWNNAYNFPDPQASAQQYRDLIADLKAWRPDAVIIVGTLSPQRGETEAQTSAIPGYAAINAAAREIANESLTDNIYLADFAKIPYDPTTDYWDVIHWLQPGADKSAKAIADIITSVWYPE
ncbi:MAG: GDSL-type esterase/lipase family protein [Rickettsiales bacterium]